MGEKDIKGAREFDFTHTLETVPDLKEFLLEVEGEMEKMGVEYSQEYFSGLFSKMDGVMKETSWVSWFNRNVPDLGGKKPRDMMVKGEIDQVEEVMVTIAEGVYM